jgi:hypothetical protein
MRLHPHKISNEIKNTELKVYQNSITEHMTFMFRKTSLFLDQLTNLHKFPGGNMKKDDKNKALRPLN